MQITLTCFHQFQVNLNDTRVSSDIQVKLKQRIEPTERQPQIEVQERERREEESRIPEREKKCVEEGTF